MNFPDFIKTRHRTAPGAAKGWFRCSLYWLHPCCLSAKRARQHHIQHCSSVVFSKTQLFDSWTLSFGGTWLLLFWYNIIVKCFWNILEQLSWKNYVETILDIANADFISIFTLRYKQWFWALCFQCSSWTKPVLLHSSTWCTSNCCSSSFLVPGSPECKSLIFHPDTLWSCSDWLKAIIKLWSLVN